jgi:hypothetical protein
LFFRPPAFQSHKNDKTKPTNAQPVERLEGRRKIKTPKGGSSEVLKEQYREKVSDDVTEDARCHPIVAAVPTVRIVPS